MHMNNNRLPILDIWVDPVTMDQALSITSTFVEKGEQVHTIFAANPEKNDSVPKDPLLYNMFKEADLIIPDGIGMVLAAWILHGKKLQRVPGCELMQRLCALAEEKGYKIFIYGAQEEVNKKAVETLRQRHGNIQIVGRSNGYVSEKKMDDLVEKINASMAQILFVALGSPAQEKWISTYRDRLEHVRVCQGIGGTLDVIAGTVRRAPEIYCRLGLEWLFRLIDDPSRIKRQKVLPVFALSILKQRLLRLAPFKN